MEIGRVDSIWEARQQARSMIFLCLTPFEMVGISDFYQMRELNKGGEGKFIGVRVSVCNFVITVVWRTK
jgi:hypothetical protein